MRAGYKYFGELCLEKGLIGEDDLARALSQQKEKGGRLGEVLELRNSCFSY